MNLPADPKSRLRREARERRDALDPAWRREASVRISAHALALPEFAEARNVAAYISVGSEVDTRELIADILHARGRVALPRLDHRTGRLEHRWVRSVGGRCFSPGAFGIPEPDPAVCTEVLAPSEIDLGFIPGLAFDSRGHRLGMGGGHYDRFFELAPGCRKFGLGFSVQQIPAIPDLAHDIPMHGLLTELGVVRF